MRILRWKELCPGGEGLHVTFVERSSKGSWRLHGHDFHEIFWVDSGIGTHFVGAQADPLRLVAGQLVFVRSRDFHGLAAEASREPFALVNIAFSVEAWRQLRNHYGLARHPFFDEKASRPPSLEIAGPLHRGMSEFFHSWVRRPRTALSRDAFLLGLAARISSRVSNHLPAGAPAWLRRGLLCFESDPSLWSGGPASLAAVCGCSRTHLARAMKDCGAPAPSEWILALRLERAARLLEATGLSVTDVAAQSGFENLSHFHRCFARRHGVTPLRYRKSARGEAF